MKTFEVWKKETGLKHWPNADEQTLRRMWEDENRYTAKEKLIDLLLGAFREYGDEEEYEYARDEIERSLAGQGEVGVAYTTCGLAEEHELQASYDLEDMRLIGYLDEEEVISIQFDDLEQLARDVRESTWDDFYSWMTDAEQVRKAQDEGDYAGNIFRLYAGYYNADQAEYLQRVYSEHSGNPMPRSEQEDPLRNDLNIMTWWLIDHNDDLGDIKVRDALDEYYSVMEEYDD